MVYWLTESMGGEIPRKDPRLLPDSNAAEAWNVDLSSGALLGLPTPTLVIDLAATQQTAALLAQMGGKAERAYRLPDPTGGTADLWLPLPSKFSSVVRSPLANDTYNRIYWTNPPGGPNPGAWFTTHDMLQAGDAPFNLGFTAPDPTTLITVACDPTPSAQFAAQTAYNNAIAAQTADQTAYDNAYASYTAALAASSAADASLAANTANVAATNSNVTLATNNYDQAVASGNEEWTAAALIILQNAQNDYDSAINAQTAAQALATPLDAATVAAASVFGAAQTALAAANTTVANALGVLDTIAPEVARSYLFTFIDEFGFETSPSLPSAIVTGPPDGTWTISGLPTASPVSPPGKNYPTIIAVNLYRTITGTTTGGQFFLTVQYDFPPFNTAGQAGPPPGGVYTDAFLDEYIALNHTLFTAAFAPPLDNMDGLISLPGGMLVGFTGNTIHFCEPDYPQAWPAEYDLSCQYDIQTLALWQQTLMVLTAGYPMTGNGNTPAGFTLAQVQVAEPCIARGSVITDLLGVYYASQNGLVMLSYYGMVNQTLQMVTKNIWLADFSAGDIVACRHRAQYLAMTGNGIGFIIDYTDQRQGIVHISTFADADCIWNDVFTGDAYVCSGNKVYLWDNQDSTDPGLVWRWRSKVFSLPAPASLGACQITLSPDVLAVKPPVNNPIGNGDPTLVLPDGINATFALYVADQRLVFQNTLSEERPIFRLPSGFLSFDWQFEIVANTPVYRVELASTMEELKRV